jgi:FHA domain
VSPTRRAVPHSRQQGVSRHHATIEWLPDTKSYCIKCHGKNGMVVGGKWYAAEGAGQLM